MLVVIGGRIMEIRNVHQENLQNALQINAIKKEIEAQKQYAGAVLQMGQESNDAVNLHANKAATGHIDTYA